jgi:hypothetical protein
VTRIDEGELEDTDDAIDLWMIKIGGVWGSGDVRGEGDEVAVVG